MPKFEVPVRWYAPWMFAILLSLCLVPICSGQVSSASLSVSISDSTGAVIQHAKVIVKNVETNQEQPSTSGPSGLATFAFLKPGHYSLLVSKESFADINVGGIVLNVGDDKHLRVTLQVGAASQIVSVDGSGLTINTTDASVSTVIDRHFVENIPLNGRSFQDLISMTPGVLTQSPQSSSATGPGFNGDFSVNGQRTESNYYTVDGVTGNVGAGNGYGVGQAASAGGVASSTALGTTQSLLSVDSLQEFRVESSTYSAEFGRSPGGQFSFVTRSGTNDVHGTAFDYFRNDVFDSNDWFSNYNHVKKPALRQNDFGGTFGGPIWFPKLYNGKNKSFFFASYEGLRLTQPQVGSIQYVPDTYMRQQAPAALQPILNAWPVQTGTDYGTAANPSLAVFLKSYSLPSSINSTGVRLDHTVSPKLALFFRANYTPSSTESRTLSSVTSQDVNTQTYTLGATSQLRSSLNNEFRLGYAGSSSSRTSALDSFGGAQPVDFQRAMAGGEYGEFFEGQAQISLAAVGTTQLTTLKTKNSGQQWNIVDSLNWSIGKHQVKIGIDYLNVRSFLGLASPYVSASYQSVASVLNNKGTQVSVSQRQSSTPIFNYGSVFIQDEWRLNSRLSLSGGIRWELDPPPHEAHGNDAYTLTGSPSSPASLALAPRGTPLWKTTYLNFAPRLGLAWQAHEGRGHETVLRAGGGIFFDSDNWAATQGYSAFAIGLSATSNLPQSPLPLSPQQVNFPISVAPPYTSASVYAFPSHLQLPYTFQWNASLEQALGDRQSLTISYVAANGRRLIGEQQFNVKAQNPLFGTVVFLNANLSSSYNSLQVKYQRSVAHGLQSLTSYTWSHSIDFGSAALVLPTTRASSDFDVRHNLSTGLTWDIPNSTRLGAANRLTNNWGVDGRLIARTAFPFNINGSLLTDPLGQQYRGGVNFVSGKRYYLYSDLYPGGRSLNSAAFVANASATQNGTVPRNYFRGFDEVQLNLSLRRAFHITDSTSLQFHADAFNILNHPNFGAVDTTLSDALFGQATSTLSQSLTTVAPQYQQGGPRSFQLSLKLAF
ncbi:MAG: carboxypeptidase regulatory-like domain-containing protein [Acidobacteriota bacterium]|nr:carboxypeptidase regulatory-like domain-containing protein [Acidobacteriota bacterium]